MGCTKKACAIASIVIGLVIVVIAGVVGFYGIPNIVDNAIEEELVIKPGHDSFDDFLEPPIDVFMEFYFFNITNMDEFPEKTVIPEVQEYGPCVFKEIRTKHYKLSDPGVPEVEIFDNGTLSFFLKRNWIFDEEKSKATCSLDQEFTIPNVAVC